MREWQLTADNPLSMRFAADVRLTDIDYADDQSWEIVFGNPQEPALAFQTRYGGRVGMARFVPMFVLDGKPIYETNTFAVPPALRHFAPNYALLTAELPIKASANLKLAAELWVMDSHAVGGRFTLTNSGSQPVTLWLELFAQLARDGEMVDMNMLGLDDGTAALHLGKFGGLNPILLMEGAKLTPSNMGEHVSPKLTVNLTVPANGNVVTRWVEAARPEVNDSLQMAYRWLAKTDWDAAVQQIDRINANLPMIETGNPDLDAAIAFSQHILLRSFIGANAQLPSASFVSARIPARGFSPHPDGSDHGWQWSGQTAALSYLVAPASAILNPDLGRGVIRNFLAVQQTDGGIDFKPGLGGQRAKMLATPLLAQTVWRIYELTQDKKFLEEVFAGLIKFHERWFLADNDRNQDGIPEWTTTNQSGYDSNPLFTRFQRWAENLDISKTDAPDLLSYLVTDARALVKSGEIVADGTAHARMEAIQARLTNTLVPQLEQLWNEQSGSYLYRDRDTKQTPAGSVLFRGKGDESFSSSVQLDPANRLILRIIGGKDYPPRTSVTIAGRDHNGKAITETIPGSAFAWSYGMGAAVSEHSYSQINSVKFEGISRVYNTEVATVDLHRENQTLLLPLWTSVPDSQRVARIVQTLTDPARYWRPFGIPVCPANDPAFAADNNNGSGGVWLLWNTMLIEGLLAYQYRNEAKTLLNRIFDAQIRSLKQTRSYHEAYNSETGNGLGDPDELAGIIPLGLVYKVLGLAVIDKRTVWAGGEFLFDAPVKILQNGIEITRSTNGTSVHFPSGHSTQVGPEWQLITDPTPEPPPSIEPPTSQNLPIPAALTTPTPSISDGDAPPLIPVDSMNKSAVPNMGSTPPPPAMIKVESKKDDTMEIPITQIDFSALSANVPAIVPPKPEITRENTESSIPPKKENPQVPPSTSTSGTIKIPVRGDSD